MSLFKRKSPERPLGAAPISSMADVRKRLSGFKDDISTDNDQNRFTSNVVLSFSGITDWEGVASLARISSMEIPGGLVKLMLDSFKIETSTNTVTFEGIVEHDTTITRETAINTARDLIYTLMVLDSLHRNKHKSI